MSITQLKRDIIKEGTQIHSISGMLLHFMWWSCIVSGGNVLYSIVCQRLNHTFSDKDICDSEI